ncbi:MAG: efflux RND transporter permease subunit, partial [Vallitaleaceae bacterium]|nr:efflux RND transporter permease subunit [Vallitaleaceae bacterium]
IAAFSPLLFIPSIVGDYIISVPQVIIISLSASYVVSITLRPCLSYLMFNHMDAKVQKGRLFRYIENTINWLLRRKALVLTSVLIITVVAVLIIPKIGLSFFPKADKDIFYINITNKDGINIDDTEVKAEKIEAYLRAEPHISHYLTTVGGGVPRFWDTMRTYGKASDFAQILVQVDLNDDYENNTGLVEKLQADLNLIDPTLKIEVKELEKGEPIEAPITIEVTSKKLEDITDAKDYTKEILERIEGVTFIRDNEAIAINSYEINYDNKALVAAGLALPLVQAEVSYAINGKEVATIKELDGFTAVAIKGEVADSEALLDLVIGHDQAGTGVTLKEVATLEVVQNRSSINKYQGDYAVTVLANVKSGYNSVEIMKEFEEVLNKNEYPTITWLYEGEQTSIANNFGDLGMMAMFAGFLILIILVIQFNSFGQTAIILMSIPLAGAGALFGLYFTGYPLSFTALLGIVSLMGIVVNNAILLMDSIDKRRSEGLNIKDSAIEGSKKRIRPILLTTITTISGLIPLMISKSEMFAPMAIAIGSGLLFSTVITLLVIPILYRILYGKKDQTV